MIKQLIIGVIIVVLIMVMTTMDTSKEARLARIKKRREAGETFNRRVQTPIFDFFDKHTSDVKKEKVNDRYKRAGFKKINFAANGLICLILALVCGIAVGIFMKNVFMGIVFFGIGWNVPSLVMGFIANKRIEALNDQVGMFMRMVTKRYQVVGDFYFALGSTVEDFEGEEPMYSELMQTMAEINHGAAIDDALHELAHRTENKFLRRFADYYEITAEIGTQEAKNVVLQQALEQYEQHMKLSKSLKRQLSELTMEAYVMLGFVPCVVAYQINTNDDYIEFMTTTLLGKFGSAVIAAVWLLCFWIINTKLAAPVDKENEEQA